VQRAQGNYRTVIGIGSNLTLDAGYVGALAVAFGAFTVTLPPLTAVGDGAAFHIQAAAGGYGFVTLARSGSDTIFDPGVGNVTTYAIRPGKTLTVVRLSSGWYLTDTGVNNVTPPQFNNDVDTATTQFVNRVGLQYSGDFILNASTTLTVAHAGARVQLGGAGGYTITLPSAASFRTGATITFWTNVAVGVLIQAVGADVIAFGGGFNLSPVPMAPGDTLVLESIGSQWIAVGGSVPLSYSRPRIMARAFYGDLF
jgi:hypothetical protein